MTIIAYQTLYESAIAFGMRKSLQSEDRRIKITGRVREKQTCTEYEREVEELEVMIEEIARKNTEEIKKDQKNHTEKLA
eukprot:CAMPEP_0168338428 /NCGR_PEP_ID=MMETSP0213-20121227/12832_1 /TAXON_ID=151035 /ORGANISM="Euplotes harpa, Strain FSP1.4" /LENGTH=78 /DNA_ID=CAMNT_0008344211 /DNA_START=348 /DNA_END=581 /DNA_ORIENTATION=-